MSLYLSLIYLAVPQTLSIACRLLTLFIPYTDATRGSRGRAGWQGSAGSDDGGGGVAVAPRVEPLRQAPTSFTIGLKSRSRRLARAPLVPTPRR